jgi:uncharacterized protein YueI
MNNQIAGGINKDIINKIIIDNGLSVSYSITYNDITINKNSNKIYPIHSISKLFTNIMLVLLYNDNIINNEELHIPIKIEQIVLDKLSKTYPNISFQHAAPGFVNTHWGKDFPSLLLIP